MSLELVRELWDYHHWANRRLFDVTAGLGDDVARREMGKQWSVPTMLGTLAHIAGADRWWLERWKGQARSVPADDMFYGYEPATLADLRRRWDDLIGEQRAFVGGLGDADLGRVIEGTSRLGSTFRRPLGMLLLHVPNHATHHRSELATMITMTSGSPPDTGVNTYCGWKSEQRPT